MKATVASHHPGQWSKFPEASRAYVYSRETQADADIARVLTLDEARRIASNIAKLPTFLALNREISC